MALKEKIGPRALQLTAVPCKLKSILSEILATLFNDLENEVEGQTQGDEKISRFLLVHN